MSLDLFEKLAPAVANILKQHDWQLVGPDDDKATWDAFLHQVAGYLSESEGRHMTDAVRLDRTVTGAYCPILYEAACADGSHRQHRAFLELHRWIFVRIRRKISHPSDAEDVAQETLEALYRKLDDVTKPRGFLAFVSAFVRIQILRYYGQANRLGRRETPLTYEEDEEDHIKESEGLFMDESVFNQLEIKAAEEELWSLVEGCFSKRAWKQKIVFAALELQERSVLEVAEMLETTPNSVYSSLHRAKKNLLENCPELIERLLLAVPPASQPKITGEIS